jgi:hypothetical protein
MVRHGRTGLDGQKIQNGGERVADRKDVYPVIARVVNRIMVDWKDGKP